MKCIICNSTDELRHNITIHIDDVKGVPSLLCEHCFKLMKQENPTLSFKGDRIMELHRQANSRRGGVNATKTINERYTKKEISDMKRRAVNTRYGSKEKGRGKGESDIG